MIYFLPYFVCLWVFIFKELSPLKIEIAKSLIKKPLNGQNLVLHVNKSVIKNKDILTKDNNKNNSKKNKNKTTKENNKNNSGKNKHKVLKDNKKDNSKKNKEEKQNKIKLKNSKIESGKSNNKRSKKSSNKSNSNDNNHHKKSDKKNKTKIINFSVPPKKSKNGHKYLGKESEELNLYQRKMNKNKTKTRIKNSFNSNSDSLSVTLHKTQTLNSKRKFVETHKNDDLNFFKKINMEQNQSKNKSKKEEKKEKKVEEKLSDFELNDLEYAEAIELDKRHFGQIYWSTLMREHMILFTFFSWNDYNIVYIKIARFFFLVSTDMAMNVVFFSDDSMHKVYLNYGEYDFVQQIPQIIYSTAISQMLEVFLCFLSLTDKYFYEIKSLKNDKHMNQKIFRIFRCIKIKLIIFFVFTLILFAFYWFFVSAFCAVYKNTQITYIKDSVSSFLTGLLYPFALYLIPCLLRILSLYDVEKKRLNFIYELSDIIPFF